MTPAQACVHRHRQRLKGHRMAQGLATVAEDATTTQLSDPDCLTQRLEAAGDARDERTPRSRARLAHVPCTTTLADCDCSCHPSIAPKQSRALATLRCLDQGDNSLVLGPPGPCW
jgi:hypothetical protein